MIRPTAPGRIAAAAVADDDPDAPDAQLTEPLAGGLREGGVLLND
jgi:hypothetical protein